MIERITIEPQASNNNSVCDGDAIYQISWVSSSVYVAYKLYEHLDFKTDAVVVCVSVVFQIFIGNACCRKCLCIIQQLLYD